MPGILKKQIHSAVRENMDEHIAVAFELDVGRWVAMMGTMAAHYVLSVVVLHAEWQL